MTEIHSGNINNLITDDVKQFMKEVKTKKERSERQKENDAKLKDRLKLYHQQKKEAKLKELEKQEIAFKHIQDSFREIQERKSSVIDDNIDDDIKPPFKRYKSENMITKTDKLENFSEDSDEKLLNNFMDNTDISSLPSHNCTPEKNKEKNKNTSIHSEDSNLSFTQYNPDFDFYLRNFTNAIESVLEQEIFSCLLDEFDREIIKKFSLLGSIFSFSKNL